MDDYNVDDIDIEQMLEQKESDVRCHISAKKSLQELGLDTLYDDLKSRLAPEDTTAVRRFYEAGKLLMDLYRKYSDSEARKIIDQLGRMEDLNIRTLTACFKFSKEFTQNDVMEIQGFINPDTGKRVTQTHLQYVMADFIVDRKDPITGAVTKATQIRKYYLKSAVERNLSAMEMRKMLQADYTEKDRKKEKNVGGRPHLMPGNPDQMLVQVSEFLDKPLKKCREVWFRDDAENIVTVLDSEPETVTEVTRSEVLTAKAKAMELLTALTRLIQILDEKDKDYQDIILKNYEKEAKLEESKSNVRVLSE